MMEILSSEDYAKMEQLLGGDDAPETVMTVPMACGFLHGLAITPEPVSPGSWIPMIFGGELPELEEAELSGLMHFFIAIFNAYLLRFHHDRLVFPFSYDRLDADGLHSVQEWLIGLHEAVSSHYDIWMQEEDPFIHDDQVEDVSLSLFYLHCLAWPEEVKEALAEGDGFDPTDDETIANLLSGVPSIVATLTGYGREKDRQRTAGMYDDAKSAVRPGGKIGRNAPCPCGSGKKFKKCCARSNRSVQTE